LRILKEAVKRTNNQNQKSNKRTFSKLKSQGNSPNSKKSTGDAIKIYGSEDIMSGCTTLIKPKSALTGKRRM
jgi:hypothetical protein